MGKVAHRALPLEVPAQLNKLVDADIAHQLLTHYEAYVKEVGEALHGVLCVVQPLVRQKHFLTCIRMLGCRPPSRSASGARLARPPLCGGAGKTAQPLLGTSSARTAKLLLRHPRLTCRTPPTLTVH